MSEKLKGAYQKTLDKTYLGHWDVPEDGDLVLTIDHFEKNDIKSATGSSERKHICYFKESKPMVVNKTNLKTIAQVFGSDKFEDWEGKPIALYAAPVPQADSGKGLRVRPYKPIVAEYYCEECGDLISDTVRDGKKYRAAKIAEQSKAKFGRCLCFKCASKVKEQEELI